MPCEHIEAYLRTGDNPEIRNLDPGASAEALTSKPSAAVTAFSQVLQDADSAQLLKYEASRSDCFAINFFTRNSGTITLSMHAGIEDTRLSVPDTLQLQ